MSPAKKRKIRAFKCRMGVHNWIHFYGTHHFKCKRCGVVSRMRTVTIDSISAFGQLMMEMDAKDL